MSQNFGKNHQILPDFGTSLYLLSVRPLISRCMLITVPLLVATLLSANNTLPML